MKSPPEEIILKAWIELNRIYRSHGTKRSVKFADENNVSLTPHQVMHKMIAHLGGWCRIDRVLQELTNTEVPLNEIKICTLFHEKYLHYWKNQHAYLDVNHCVGLYELQNGYHTQLINTRTGKHIMSDGSTLDS